MLLEHLCSEYPTIIPFFSPPLFFPSLCPWLAKRHSLASHSDSHRSHPALSFVCRDRRRRLSIVGVSPSPKRRTLQFDIYSNYRDVQRRSLRLQLQRDFFPLPRHLVSVLHQLFAGLPSPLSPFTSSFLSTPPSFVRFVTLVVGLSRESRNFILL